QLSKQFISFPPDLQEEQQLGYYFKSLNLLIKATTKKISSLRQLKAASLQSMFPQAGETKPRVRFKGFEGEWAEKKLSDCLEVSKDRNLDGIYGRNDVLSVSDDFGVMNQIELLGRSYAGKSVSNYGVLRTGEIVYTKSPLKSKPFGIIKQNMNKTGIVSVLYAIYKVKEGTAAEYIHYYFDPEWRLNAYIRPLVNKGAKNTMNINDEMVLTGLIWIPSTLDEQQQIANFFRSLDTQISLETQRLEKLKQIKSACLDKMFV
ncbi:MAG: restriction endonuclease subunit S, partial [Bacteroides sp.]|nr:restriction endonuclease subunit S [Bacteroides sp.]